MPRAKRDPEALKELTERFTRLVDRHLELSDRELAEALGYSGTTTLSRVRKGGTFLDIERLVRLADLETQSGGRPNIHWLLTGQGEPILQPEDLSRTEKVERLIDRVKRLEEPEVDALTMLLIKQQGTT